MVGVLEMMDNYRVQQATPADTAMHSLRVAPLNSCVGY